MNVQPVILCGGSGSRLWPLSTPGTPKQFVSIQPQGPSLLDLTISRLQGNRWKDPILVSNIQHIDRLPKLPHILEKVSLDTGFAIANVTNHTLPDDILVIVPSDHYIADTRAFITTLSTCIEQAESESSYIYLIGIVPSSPETKYGYIIPGAHIHFEEKPNVDRAMELIHEGAYWNSGIIVCKQCTLLKSVLTHYPELLGEDPPRISFDVAVLQKATNLRVQKAIGWGWSDVGTWSSLYEIISNNDVAVKKPVLVKSPGCKVVSRTQQDIIMIGCDGFTLVVAEDGVLIMKNDNESLLKEAVANLT